MQGFLGKKKTPDDAGGSSEKLDLSARASFKTIKVARTIADLDGSEIVRAKHLAEALTYRRR